MMFCSNCNSLISIKDTEEWISMKCKCKIAIYYRDGHFSVVPKHIYLKNKELKKVGL